MVALTLALAAVLLMVRNAVTIRAIRREMDLFEIAINELDRRTRDLPMPPPPDSPPPPETWAALARRGVSIVEHHVLPRSYQKE